VLYTSKKIISHINKYPKDTYWKNTFYIKNNNISLLKKLNTSFQYKILIFITYLNTLLAFLFIQLNIISLV